LCDQRVNFDLINQTASSHLPVILARWLPDGKQVGREWVARNPRRDDRHPGSFSVNIRTGKWSDFATGDRGGDVISLAAYLFGQSQVEAAHGLMRMLGVGHD
jgi:hypothetical protein